MSAATCLSSPHCVSILGPAPTTERGVATVITVHPQDQSKIIFPSGRSIVVKNLNDNGDTFVYRGHNQPTTVAKFSPNGYWVASGDISGKVRVWSWDNPEHILKIEIPAFTGPVADIDWDSESKKLVVSGEGGQFLVKCLVWDTGSSAGEMVGHTKKVLSCCYKPTRPFKIMTGSIDFDCKFYAGPPFKMDHSNNVHTNFVNCVRYSPDGTKVVSVSSDKKIQVYDGASGHPVVDAPDAHGGSILSVSFSPDSTKLATASGDKTLKIWDSSTLKCLHTLSSVPSPDIGDMQTSVAWTALGIVSLSLNGDLHVFQPDASAPQTTFQGHQSPITSLCTDPESRKIFTGSASGVVCVTTAETSVVEKVRTQEKKSINGAAHTGNVTDVGLVGDQLVSIGYDDKIRFADVATNACIDAVSTTGQPLALGTSSAAGYFAVLTSKGVYLYRNKTVVASIENLPYSGTCIALYGEEEVAIGGDDSKTHVYSVANGKLMESKVLQTRSIVSSVAYHPTGQFLAIGDSGRQVEVYERGSWVAKIQSIWLYHTSRVARLAWSPSGDHLASGGLDDNVFVWSLATPKKYTQFTSAHKGGVTGLAWLGPRRLVSAGFDQTIVQWEVPIE